MQREVGHGAVGERRRRQAQGGGRVGAHPPHQDLERQTAGPHQVGVAGGEGGLEAGDPERGLLERDLLLVARVGGVVGGHAVDGAVGEGRDQGLAVGLLPQRRVHLVPRRVERLDRGVGEREVVRRDLGGDAHAARLGAADLLRRLGGGDVADVDPPALVLGQAASRATATLSEIEGIPPSPRRLATAPSCTTPVPDSVGSSSCSTSGGR